MDLKSLSLPERVAAGAGCVVVLAAIAAGVLYGVFEFRATALLREDLARAPAGWAAALRTWGQAPVLTGLVAARTDAGDGATEAHDTTRAWRLPGIETAYRALSGGPETATSADSAIWSKVDNDTSLDRFVRLARRREWRALDAVLALGDSTVRRNVLAMPMPKYGDLRNASRALVIRAIMRLDRGDRDGARADLGATMAIGEQLFRREPSLIGTIIGRSIMGSGANGWARWARDAHDSVLGARAMAVREWAGAAPGSVAEYLIAAPDTALTFAQDTALALGMRAEGLNDILLGYMARPRGSMFGVPSRYRAALRALSRDPDGDLARLAAMTAATASRINFRGLSDLQRESQPAGAR
jgi:hypothetical protein